MVVATQQQQLASFFASVSPAYKLYKPAHLSWSGQGLTVVLGDS